MPCCLIAFLMVLFPRVAIVLLYFFTNLFERAHLDILILILGFILLPLTTIVYAYTVSTGHQVDGIYLLGIILAVLADLGLLGGGAYQRRRT